MIDFIGFAGALFILLAWIPETYRTIKSKNIEALDIRFFLLYIIGTSLLFYHSYQIKDDVFLALNACILIIQIIELCVVLRKKKVFSRTKKRR